jgi:hypothetical protein
VLAQWNDHDKVDLNTCHSKRMKALDHSTLAHTSLPQKFITSRFGCRDRDRVFMFVFFLLPAQKKETKKRAGKRIAPLVLP